jgi:hypothetical protein
VRARGGRHPAGVDPAKEHTQPVAEDVR